MAMKPLLSAWFLSQALCLGLEVWEAAQYSALHNGRDVGIAGDLISIWVLREQELRPCISPETPGDANAGSSQILLTAAKAWRLTEGCTCLGDLSRQNPKLNSAAAGS